MSEDINLDSRTRAALGDEAVWASPPGDLESGVMAAIAAEQIVDRNLEKSSSGWWPAVAVAAAVVALFLAFGPIPSPQPEGTPLALEGTDAAPQAVASGSAGPSEAGWWIRLDIDGLAPAASDAYYEGWVSNGTDLVSVGTFHMRDGDSVVLWSGVSMQDFPELTVTRQSLSQGTAPSEVVVLRGWISGRG